MDLSTRLQEVEVHVTGGDQEDAQDIAESDVVDGEVIEEYIPATRYVLLSMDMVMTQHEMSPELVLGIEAVAHEMIAFRGGIGIYGEKLGKAQLFPMNTWGGGISIRPEIKDLPFKTNIDYTIGSEFIANNGIWSNFYIVTNICCFAYSKIIVKFHYNTMKL